MNDKKRFWRFFTDKFDNIHDARKDEVLTTSVNEKIICSNHDDKDLGLEIVNQSILYVPQQVWTLLYRRQHQVRVNLKQSFHTLTKGITYSILFCTKSFAFHSSTGIS